MSQVKKRAQEGPVKPYAYVYQGNVYCASHLPVRAWDPDVSDIAAVKLWAKIPCCHKCGKPFSRVKVKK